MKSCLVKMLKLDLPCVVGILMACSSANAFTVDANIPEGNIVVQKINGDQVYLQNDWSGHSRPWIYWAFRVNGAEGRKLHFHLAGEYVSTRGPVVSVDRGKSWKYAAETYTKGDFTYAFPASANEVWFAMTIPYTRADWDDFIARHETDRQKVFETGTLCVSPHGRNVIKARFGRLDGKPDFRILLTARHHACETTASPVLEGILEAVFGQDDLGAWFREFVEIMVVPFMDLDGVEEGCQGKNRLPRDHGADYFSCFHPETAGLKRWIAESPARTKLDLTVDLHSPWLRGEYNEWVYQVCVEFPKNTIAQRRLGEILTKTQSGALDYNVANDIPWNFRWNSEKYYRAYGLTFYQWLLSFRKDIACATLFEIPFATANSATVTRETCKTFGKDLAKAFQLFLMEHVVRKECVQ